MRVLIDPGHGGKDPGACFKSLKEKDLTLAIAQRIRDQLKLNDAIQIKLSREVDETCSLTKRVEIAERFKADLYLSIHINAGGGTGFESYRYLTTNHHTTQIHNEMHEKIVQTLEVTDRGMKVADFFVLRKTTMPAILTESLFIDHYKDYEVLKNESMINKIAAAHAEAIILLNPTEQKEKHIMCGSFNKLDHAKIRQRQLKEVGYNSRIITTYKNEKMFYRVIIKYLNAKKQTEKTLKALGFDTFII